MAHFQGANINKQIFLQPQEPRVIVHKMPKSHGIELNDQDTTHPSLTAIISEPQRALGGEGLGKDSLCGAGDGTAKSLHRRACRV